MSKKILLIADDDEMNRRIIKRFLKNDFDILEADDGKKTLELLNGGTVDALLLDIIMPELDGLEVLKIMSGNGMLSKTAVLVATSTKEKTERTALSLGADDIVSKPYDPIVIKKRLDNILAAKEANRQREMFRTSDIDAVVADRTKKLLEKTELSSARIKKCADIINANKTNGKLVADITEEIKREAEALIKAFKE